MKTLSFLIMVIVTVVVAPVAQATAIPDGWPSWIGRLDDVQVPVQEVEATPAEILDPVTGGVRARLLENGEWSDGWPSWIGRI